VEIGRAFRAGGFMSEPTILPVKAAIDRPEFRKLVASWRNLLADSDLVESSIFFNYADYEDIRIPEFRRRWFFGKKDLIDWSGSAHWERETEDYAVVIPVGGQRRAGTEMGFREPLLTLALEELGKRPARFPNLRQVPTESGIGEDLWWGEDISALWNRPRTLEVHRAIGRAFGYREDRILELYRDTWVDS
jgi:hypothetical protein